MTIWFKIITLILLPFLVGIFMPVSENVQPVHGEFDFNPERLDGRFTGGFGEQTCHSCHFDYDINMDGGAVSVEGLPETYRPGNSYEVVVIVESIQLENGGFQMTARFEDGSQAGLFDWAGDHLMYTPNISDEIKYVQHTRESTRPSVNGEVSWKFKWTAPESRTEKIFFNIAANAGNDDDSAFGDWIYVKELVVNPE